MLAGLLLTALLPNAPQTPEIQAAVDARLQIARTLDAWHQAAAEAKEEDYFRHLSPDAIFFGTDMTERWNVEQFRKFAHPYFAKGKAWTFKAVKRNVYLAKDAKTAWFDEELETANLGPCRGTGVLVLDGKDWKIVQYNLSTPIPNEIFDKVKKQIEDALKVKKP